MPNIVSSLFGHTPIEIQQAQQAQIDASADHYAAQQPFQRAAGQMFRAGAGLAQPVAGMLGMTNPQMEEARAAQDIMSQVDATSAEGLARGAMIANRMGQPRLAFQLAQAAQQRKAQEQQSILAQRKDAREELKMDRDAVWNHEAKLRELELRETQIKGTLEEKRLSREQQAMLQQALMEIRRQQLDIQRDALAAKQSMASEKLTKGEEAADRAFAKEYVEFKAAGGYSDVEKQLSQLQQVAGDLGKKSNDFTGPVAGLIPDKVRAFTNPDAVAAKDKVQEVAQRNLRLVLGAQFTEKEGERLIARAYNPSLPPEENKRRVDALVKQIRTAAQAKKDASEYFEKHGTLRGWGGKLPTLADIESAIETPTNATPVKPIGRALPAGFVPD